LQHQFSLVQFDLAIAASIELMLRILTLALGEAKDSKQANGNYLLLDIFKKICL
jgi:hypothetical protein